MNFKRPSIYLLATGLALSACSRSSKEVPAAPTVGTPEVMTRQLKSGDSEGAKTSTPERSIKKVLENSEIKETSPKPVDPRWVTADQDSGAKAPEGQKIDPKPLPTQDPHSNLFPPRNLRTEPDPNKPIPVIGGATDNQAVSGPTDFKIEILNKDLLVAIDSKELLTLYINSLATKQRALADLMEQGRGVYCQTEGAASVEAKDVLQLVDGDIKESPEDKTIKISIFKFKSGKDKTMTLVCTSRGTVSEAEFQENFKGVIAFPNADNASSGTSHAPETAEEAKANDLKRKSFKILNLEALTATIAKDSAEHIPEAIMDGQLASAAYTQAMVLEGKAPQTCQVARVTGQLQKDQIYRHTDTRIMDKDNQNKVVLISYQYDIDEKNNVSLFCLVRFTTHVNEFFNTFKGILEFGVEK